MAFKLANLSTYHEQFQTHFVSTVRTGNISHKLIVAKTFPSNIQGSLFYTSKLPFSIRYQLTKYQDISLVTVLYSE